MPLKTTKSASVTLRAAAASIVLASVSTSASAGTLTIREGLVDELSLYPAGYNGTSDGSIFYFSGANDVNNHWMRTSSGAATTFRIRGTSTQVRVLSRFELNALAGQGLTVNSATLRWNQTNTATANFTANVYRIAAANYGWLEGTGNTLTPSNGSTTAITTSTGDATFWYRSVDVAAGGGDNGFGDPAGTDTVSVPWASGNVSRGPDGTTPGAAQGGLLNSTDLVSTTPIASFVRPASTGGAMTFTLPIAMVQSWIDAPLTNAGMLTTSNLGQGVDFSSSENGTAANRPTLILDVSRKLYWDIDGETAGSGGAAPSGNWDGSAANFTPDAAGAVAATTAATGTFDDAIFAAGTDATDAYTVTVGGTRTANSVVVSRGAVTLTGGTVETKSVNVAAGATARLDSTLASTAGLTKSGAGTLTLASANAYTGGTTVAAGTLVVAHADAINAGQALTVNAGATARVQTGLAPALDVSALTVAATGRVDLNDGGLVKRNASGAAGQTATRAVTALLKTGLENGGNFDWLGNGISSTEANADNATAGSVLFGLGVIQNNLAAAGAPDGTTTDETPGGTIYTDFKGRTVGLNDTLVRYTYMGDADLSGNIDGTDYSLIDAGFGAGSSGWLNGDFDYSGAIDGTDYALIDNAFGAQTGVLPEQVQARIAEHTALFGQSYVDALAAVQSGVVPEPATLGVLALAGAGLAARRRRRRTL